MADDEKKIIIDEDWKAQVQREKEEAAKNTVEPQEQPEAAEAAADLPGADGAPPPPFMQLVQSLMVQGMYALGLIAPQDSKQVMVNLNEAQMVIDMLTALREKTEGNLDPEESGQLAEALSELQRIYLVRAQQVQESTMRQAGIDPTNLKGPKK